MKNILLRLVAGMLAASVCEDRCWLRPLIKPVRGKTSGSVISPKVVEHTLLVLWTEDGCVSNVAHHVSFAVCCMSAQRPSIFFKKY